MSAQEEEFRKLYWASRKEYSRETLGPSHQKVLRFAEETDLSWAVTLLEVGRLSFMKDKNYSKKGLDILATIENQIPPAFKGYRRYGVRRG